jgi:hypothetical protein
MNDPELTEEDWLDWIAEVCARLAPVDRNRG